jgi:hypothetical protein
VIRKCKAVSCKYEYVSTYQRIARKLLAHAVPTKQVGFFYNGKIVIGAKSKYFSKSTRMYYLFWRIKNVGKPIIA